MFRVCCTAAVEHNALCDDKVQYVCLGYTVQYICLGSTVLQLFCTIPYVML